MTPFDNRPTVRSLPRMQDLIDCYEDEEPTMPGFQTRADDATSALRAISQEEPTRYLMVKR